MVFFYWFNSWTVNDSKNTRCLSLAPIEVEILVCWGSAHKIVTESGKHVS